MNTTNTNATGWDGSELRSWLNGRVYKSLPQIWQSAIKQVNVKASAGGGATPPPDSALEIKTSKDNLFLLSVSEYGVRNISPYMLEGNQFPLYTDDYSRKKYAEYGHDKIYWYYRTRSPYAENSQYFALISRIGADTNGAAYSDYGISFAFCV